MLRYAPAVGSTATITMVMTSDQTVTIETIEPLRTTSAMTMVWDAVVDDVRADGTTRSTLTLTDVTVDGFEGVPAETVDLLRTQLVAMVGLKGWTVSDQTGKVIDSGVDLPRTWTRSWVRSSGSRSTASRRHRRRSWPTRSGWARAGRRWRSPAHRHHHVHDSST